MNQRKARQGGGGGQKAAIAAGEVPDWNTLLLRIGCISVFPAESAPPALVELAASYREFVPYCPNPQAI